MGWIGVITNVGNALIAQLAGGGHTLTLTRASIGSGSVREANMRTAVALVSEKEDAAISGKKNITNGVQVTVRVGPVADAVGAFTGHEIGIWGKLDDGTETLIALTQDAELGIAVPTVSESYEFAFDLNVPIYTSNTDDLTVIINPSVYVTNMVLADTVEMIEQKIAGVQQDVNNLAQEIRDVGFYVDEDGYVCHRISTDESE